MEIVYIVIGWALGLFSPLIVKQLSKGSERNNLRKIILNDLRDLKKRLAPLSFKVLPKYGKMDEETFEWIKKNSDIDFSEGVQSLLENGIDSSAVVELLNERGLQDNTHSYFKKMHLFATDSHIMNFALLEDSLIEKILEIRFHIEAFNEDVDSFRESLNMTFQPGITDINHGIISRELENKSLDIAKKSIHMVDMINVILEN